MKTISFNDETWEQKEESNTRCPKNHEVNFYLEIPVSKRSEGNPFLATAWICFECNRTYDQCEIKVQA